MFNLLDFVIKNSPENVIGLKWHVSSKSSKMTHYFTHGAFYTHGKIPQRSVVNVSVGWLPLGEVAGGREEGRGGSGGRGAVLQPPRPEEVQTRSLAARPPRLATHGSPSLVPNPEPVDPRDQSAAPALLQGSGSWGRVSLCWEGRRRLSLPPEG